MPISTVHPHRARTTKKHGGINMLGLGPWELLIVLAVVLLIFGGKRLPELARGLGKSVTNFKAGLNEEQSEETENHNARTTGEWSTAKRENWIEKHRISAVFSPTCKRIYRSQFLYPS